MQAKKILFSGFIFICLGLYSEFTQAAPKTQLNGLKRGFLNTRIGLITKVAQEPIKQTEQGNQDTQQNLVTKSQIYQGLSILVDHILAKRKNGELPQDYAADLQLLGRLLDSYPKSLGPKIEPILKNANEFENLDELRGFSHIAEAETFFCLAGQKEDIKDLPLKQPAICLLAYCNLQHPKQHRYDFSTEGILLDLKPMGENHVCFLKITSDQKFELGCLFPVGNDLIKMKCIPLGKDMDKYLRNHSLEKLRSHLTLCCCSNSKPCNIIYSNVTCVEIETINVTIFKVNFDLTHLDQPDLKVPVAVEKIPYMFPPHIRINRRFQNRHQFIFDRHQTYLIIPTEEIDLGKPKEFFLILELASLPRLYPLGIDSEEYQLPDLGSKLTFHFTILNNKNTQEKVLTLWSGKNMSVFLFIQERPYKIAGLELAPSDDPKLNFLFLTGATIFGGTDQTFLFQSDFAFSQATAEKHSPSETVKKPLYQKQNDAFYYIDNKQRIGKLGLSSTNRQQIQQTLFDYPPRLADQPKSFHKWLARSLTPRSDPS
jgi:hypothetical protein